jgi:hypothetical protein
MPLQCPAPGVVGAWPHACAASSRGAFASLPPAANTRSRPLLVPPSPLSPPQMLETGHDILFFWVARMIMMGIEFTGQ